MSAFEIGVVRPLMQLGPERVTPRWTDLRAMASRAEAMGVDTLWTPDELLDEPADIGGVTQAATPRQARRRRSAHGSSCPKSRGQRS